MLVEQNPHNLGDKVQPLIVEQHLVLLCKQRNPSCRARISTGALPYDSPVKNPLRVGPFPYPSPHTLSLQSQQVGLWVCLLSRRTDAGMDGCLRGLVRVGCLSRGSQKQDLGRDLVACEKSRFLEMEVGGKGESVGDERWEGCCTSLTAEAVRYGGM